MINRKDITAIIVTLNEEIHISRCLNSLTDVCKRIVIVDSGSTDRTLEIAKTFDNVEIYHNDWINYATQFNWGIDNTDVATKWVMRIDADEYLDNTLREEIFYNLDQLEDDVSGVKIKRLMYFLGKPLKKAGMYPIWHIKIWRNGSGRCEQKWMDERIDITKGKVVEFDGNLIDKNLKNITWWTDKHNGYATKEAIDTLDRIYNFSGVIDFNLASKHQEAERAKFKNIYLKLPLFIRPFLFWFIRYFIQGGFLEGKTGFIWNLLQCGWYRFLVDVKIYEAYRKAGRNKDALIKYFYDEYGYDVTTGGK